MANPTLNDVQAVDPVLQNLAIGYSQSQDRFIADRLAPAVPVDKDSGTYYIYTKQYWFQNDMKHRAPGGVYPRGEFGLSTGTFTTIQKALAFPLADEVRANSQVPGDLESAAVRWLTQMGLMSREIGFSTDFMKTSVWGTDNTSATDWDDYSGSDPVGDVLAACRGISEATGLWPNTMAMGAVVHVALANHPDLIDRMKYTQLAGVRNIEAALAAVFGLDNYLVGKASKDTGGIGGTAAYTAVIDDDALVCYADANSGIFGATALKTFTWAPGGGLFSILPAFRDGANDADLIKAKMQWDQVVVASDLGYFFSDIV